VTPPSAPRRPSLALLVAAARGEPRLFAVSVAGSALWGCMTVASASVLGAITDRVVLPAFATRSVDARALAAAGAAVLAVSVAKAVGIMGRRLGGGVVQYRLQARDRYAVTRRYLALPPAWHAAHPSGQLLATAGADVETSWLPMGPLPMAVGVVVMVVVAAVAMLLADVQLALIALLVLPALFAVNVVYRSKVTPVATLAQRRRGEVSAIAHESFDGALVVKTLGLEETETDRFAVAANAYRDAQIGVGRLHGVFDPVLETLPRLGVLAVLAIGATRVSHHELAPGALVEVAYLFTLIAFPVQAVGWVLGELPGAVVAAGRVAAVLGAPGELPVGDGHLPVAGAPAGLALQQVSYAHPVITSGTNQTEHTGGVVGVDGRPDPPDPAALALEAVSVDLVPGSTVAVVGATGAGKTTLAGLTVRLVDPTSGSVAVDGVDLRALAAGELAGVAALVPQQTFLFDDSVTDNVTLGEPVDPAAVRAALELAQAWDFVAALPDGPATRVGERGVTLSGGQRQRIALARALVRRPRLLVLDDATSAVDPAVESAILAGLTDAGLRATVLVVASRPATIALADEVLLLDHGRLVARGRHTDLLADTPGYADLVSAYARADAQRRAATGGGR